VVDANIVVAAFLRDSTVRRLLTLSVLELMAPEFLRAEMREHLPVLRIRAGLSEDATSELLDRLEKYIDFLPAEVILAQWETAAIALGGVDPEDVAYVATALSVPCDGIWSDDPHLKAQRLVPCWTTRELVAALRGDGLKLWESGGLNWSPSKSREGAAPSEPSRLGGRRHRKS